MFCKMPQRTMDNLHSYQKEYNDYHLEHIVWRLFLMDSYNIFEKNCWFMQWWHVPIVTVILLSVIVIIALIITSFYVIHEVNYLSEDLKQMDETFLKTLSEHDRNILEQCVRISYQQTKEQVTKLWSIYMKREEIMRKRKEDEAKISPNTQKSGTKLQHNMGNEPTPEPLINTDASKDAKVANSKKNQLN